MIQSYTAFENREDISINQDEKAGDANRKEKEYPPLITTHRMQLDNLYSYRREAPDEGPGIPHPSE